MSIIATVRAFVEEECKKPTSKYGYEPFTFHFQPMVSYAERLVDEVGGDKEIVLLAAWLHDIGSIIHGREDHHKTGAAIAEKKLRELGYPEDKIHQVKNCILHHRGSQHLERKTIEEQIVAEADVLSNFDCIPGIFKVAFVYEGLDQGQARIAVRKKLQRKWEQLHFETSKRSIKPRYEAAMLLFGE